MKEQIYFNEEFLNLQRFTQLLYQPDYKDDIGVLENQYYNFNMDTFGTRI